MSTAEHVANLTKRIAAIDGALNFLQQADADPTVDRARAIAAELALHPDDEKLIEEYAALSHKAKPAADAKRQRLAVLVEKANVLQTELIGAEKAVRETASLDQRQAAVSASASVGMAAAAWDKAAQALVDASITLFEAQEPVVHSVIPALRALHPEQSTFRDNYAVIQGPATGKSNSHAQAAAALICKLMSVLPSEALRSMIEPNRYVTHKHDMTMREASEAATNAIALRLGVERSS